MTEEKPKFHHIFSWDPGDQNIGFCYFKYDFAKAQADTKIMKIFSPEELTSFLRVVWGLAEKPEAHCTFVIENFRVDSKVRGAMFQWNEMKTARVIGKVELVANWTDSKIVYQEPSILGMARKWAPWKMPKHIPDDKSAWLHGVHYMMSANYVRTTDQVIEFGQEKLG